MVLGDLCDCCKLAWDTPDGSSPQFILLYGVLKVMAPPIPLAAAIHGEGLALLLLHGFPLSRRIWLHQTANLLVVKTLAPDLSLFELLRQAPDRSEISSGRHPKPPA